MNPTHLFRFALIAALSACGAQAAQAPSFGGFHGGGFSGGGFHGGGFSGGGFSGGEFRGGGGERTGGFDGGGFRSGGFDAGGARTGGFDAGGFREGGVREGGVDAGGFRAGGFNAGGLDAGGFRTGGLDDLHAGHVGLATDGGFGRAWTGASAGRYIAAGNRTLPISSSVAAARGAVVRNSFGHYDAFRSGWYSAHPRAWFAAGWGAGRAWNVATWGALGPWCGWNVAQPIYYDYGTNVTYQDNQVYYGTQPVCTADQYYQQAETIAQSAPAPDPSATDWMPLGVFSLVQGSQSDSNCIFQLAVNKAGAIAGNYTDVLVGDTAQVHGAVDKKTQRAAWTVGANKTTVYEAGIGNLTKDESPVLVHFNQEKTQQWMLIRIKQPDSAQPAAAPTVQP